jgi:hypothetical protein
MRFVRRRAAVARSNGLVLLGVLGGHARNRGVEVPLLRDALGR